MPTTFVSIDAAGPSIERSTCHCAAKMKHRLRFVLGELPPERDDVADVDLFEGIGW